MKRKLPITIAIAAIVISLSFTYLALGHKKVDAPTGLDAQGQQSKPLPSPTPAFTGNDDVLKNALNLYLQKKREGQNMENGPCLGKIAQDWVLDIAHNPREPIDNKQENQCEDLTTGTTHHFIELDPQGKLIRSH